jgi:C4-dicarboxylate-specific signal transduction histidine kinase
MDNLELKRLNMEILKVQAARAELEFRIVERQQEITRIEQNILVQINREEELKDLFSKLKGE